MSKQSVRIVLFAGPQVLVTLGAADRQNAPQEASDEEAMTTTTIEISPGKVQANVGLSEAKFRRDEREHQRDLQSGTAVCCSDIDYRIALTRISKTTLIAWSVNLLHQRTHQYYERLTEYINAQSISEKLNLTMWADALYFQARMMNLLDIYTLMTLLVMIAIPLLFPIKKEKQKTIH